ncbi:RNA polymerase factor sigma-54 [bacterium AH-315-O15]|nr:RNA polymerase factor sigma-54 [bacterium AH-315-O15]
MVISQRLQTKLAQKLILTPSLQQAIKLLPMSTLELSELLNQEMVENPMLEEVPTEELQPVEASQEKQEEKPADKEKGDTWDDQDYEYFFGDYLDDGYRPRTPMEVKELPPIENTLSTAASLSDHLLWQLSMQTNEPLMRGIGEAIVGNLDDDGQLVATVEELAAMGPWPVEDVERTLALVQTFDPIGVAARDLQECLLLQLRHRGMGGAPAEEIVPAEKIITEHMRLLQNHQVPELARKMGMSIDDLKQHIETIRHLDPKPGSRYNPSQSQYVIPDVYIVKAEDQYVVLLNEDGLPQLRISPVYRRLMDKSVAENTDETRAYVKDKFRSALWLIKSVEQRQKTIHKVATSIIKFQSDFLDHGIEYLRPLVLRDVADDIGMHESTVSRVVTNKYMHTPQGVFEMKYFFHSGIASSYGEAVSSVTIKQRIRKIIEHEDSQRPLSDSKIVNILQREGLDLARRTIAKYREELKIPTSNQRKVLY